MARHQGPSAFFDFAGGSAGILRTTALQLPTSKGYSFATWLRVEEGLTEQQGTGGRALYAMLARGSDTRGVMAALVGKLLASGLCQQEEDLHHSSLALAYGHNRVARAEPHVPCLQQKATSKVSHPPAYCRPHSHEAAEIASAKIVPPNIL